MHFRILGPLEVLDQGEGVSIGGSKQRALLALLLLHANEPLSTDRLVDALWGERPPATAAKTVQVHVSRLRKTLAGANGGGADGPVVTREHGYELVLDPGALDAHRFAELVAEGREHLAAGRPQPAAAALERALAMWRGPPLADVASEPFAQPAIARLEDLRVTAQEALVEAKLALGDHAEVVGTLEALVAAHPYRERLRAQLMLALYRSDRQAEALQAYQDARRTLVEDLGIEPGERLRELERAVLAQDPALALPDPAAGGLPPELDDGTLMAGREAELAWLREHWRRAQGGAGHVVLVRGPPGIGKTRLAAELAAEVRRDGADVRYVAGPGPHDVAPAELARARDGRGPALVVVDDVGAGSADRGLRPALRALGEELAGAPVLVVATARDGTALAAGTTLDLAPLGPDGVRAVAELYAGARPAADVPVAELLAASGGVPERVHRVTSEWVRTAAARRVDVSARRAAGGRTDLRAAEEELASDVVALQAIRERAERRGGARDVVACPFKGLAAFEEEDADVFFGRERLVADLVARLAGAPLMAVVGPSGSGKSSALRAGLLAALAAGVLPGSERWGIALLRPGEHPLRALDVATAGTHAGGRLVVAVDQFEELFTACSDASERSAFVDALVAHTRDLRRRTLVLVAVRADFYGRCAVYPELSRLLGANHVLVGPMRRDELRRAIELPARRAGLEVEPDLTDALLADLEGEPGALPLLSTCLLELWRERDGRRLRLSTYERAGGVRGAVARLAEGTYARLDADQRPIARRILVRLAGEGDGDAVVRRRVPLASLGGDRDERTGAVLGVLADDRLVTIGAGAVEVAHEALLREWPRLRGWLAADAEGRRLHRHLADAARDWEAGGRDPGELYRGARLTAAIDWADGHEQELDGAEAEFLAESRGAAERESDRQRRANRRLRGLLTGVAALLALAVVAGVLALDQRGAAREQALSADAQRLGSRALVEADLDRALLLARQSVALDDTPQTRGNLLAALVKSPAAIGVLPGDGERMWTVSLSPDGRTLAAGDPSGTVLLFDTRTRRRTARFRPRPADAAGNLITAAWIVQLAFSPDGRHLAVAHDTPAGNVLTVVTSGGRRVVARMTPPPARFVSALRYTADGTGLDAVAVTPDPDTGPALLVRFDARSGRLLRGPTPVNRRHWSPLLVTGDGARIVTAGDGEVTLRDPSTWRAVRSVPVPGGAVPYPRAYALGPDGGTVAIGREDGVVRLHDLRTGEARRVAGRHGGPVTAVRFAPDGRTLVSAGEDGTVLVWDVASRTLAETLTGHANGISDLVLTADGRTLYTAGLDGRILIWDLAGGRRLGRPAVLGAGDQGRPQLALSTDGRLVATGQDDGAVSVVDVRTLAHRGTFPVVDTGQTLGIGFVAGSRRIVVGGPDGFLALVDVGAERVVRRLRGHGGAIFTPGISADGRLLATASDDGTVRLWSLPDGRPLGRPLRFPGREVQDAQLSPDGRWLTVVTVDDTIERGTVEIWDARRRARVHSRRVPGFPGIARFSPDGRRLAIGFRSGRTQLWSTSTWRPDARDLVGAASGIIGMAFAPDGSTIATGSDTGVVRLWDARSGAALSAPLPGEPSRAAVPYFTRDGARLIASYDTGRAVLWDIRPGSLVRQACAVAGRRLTRAEWDEYLPGRRYAPAC